MTADTEMDELRAFVQPVLRATAVYGSGCAGLGAAIADGKARPPNPDGTPLVPIEPVERAAMLAVARARAEALRAALCWTWSVRNHETNVLEVSGYGDCLTPENRPSGADPRICDRCSKLAAAEALVAEVERK